ncbi:hypothetical protein X975_13642, partial [Stegodyphus mimosarum]
MIYHFVIAATPVLNVHKRRVWQCLLHVDFVIGKKSFMILLDLLACLAAKKRGFLLPLVLAQNSLKVLVYNFSKKVIQMMISV